MIATSLDPHGVGDARDFSCGHRSAAAYSAGRSVAQGRMAVAVVVLVFEVADDHPASNRLFQWLRLRHSLANL